MKVMPYKQCECAAIEASSLEVFDSQSGISSFSIC
jgi:hypothetical protein